MLTGTLFSEEIKHQTLLPHRALEAALVIRIKQISTPADYARLLLLFNGYFSGLEALTDKNIDTKALPDYPERRKSTALDSDLNSLGFSSSKQAAARDLPAINTHLKALGTLYVPEGSTPAGRYIAKMSGERLPGLAPAYLAFFYGYGTKQN